MGHQQTADLFDLVWKKGTYQGFSRGTTGAKATPFLDLFILGLKGQPENKLAVADLGAGSGDHSLRMAEEGFSVKVVEYSRDAMESLSKRLEAMPAISPRVQIEQKNIFDYATAEKANALQGVYANAVLHFLTVDDRLRLYSLLSPALADNGIVAVSFKRQGDSLQKRSKEVEVTAAGSVGEGPDGIRRLFVSNPEPLAAEMKHCGLEVLQIVDWTIPDYNIAGENGEFVGFLARKSKNA